MTNDMKQQWIDLATLIPCSYIENGKMSISFQYSKKHPAPVDSNIMYLLRIALREVGHKIISKNARYDDEHNLMCTWYETSVSEEEHTMFGKYYNEWISEIEQS